MIKEGFRFESRDGESEIYAVRYTPNDGVVIGVVQIVHGMSEYIERYEEFARFMTDKGFVVTGEDHLGHGQTLKKDDIPGYFCEQDPATVVVRDVHRLKKITQELYPAVPYVLLGHSLGSFMVRNYMCRYGTGISAAILTGTGMQSKGLLNFGRALVAVQKKIFGSKHVGKLLNYLVFGSNNNKFKPARTPVDWLTKDEEIVNKYIADPMCGFPFTINGYGALFELCYRLYNEEYLKGIPKNLPVLIAAGTNDPIGEFGKGVQKTYDSLKNMGLENVQVKLYDKDRHELLNETDRVVVMQDIYAWIKATLPE